MDSLNEWFRYLDRVSRPARRPGGDEPALPEEWRPWRPTPEDEPLADAVEPEAIPDLSAALGAPVLPSGYQPATLSFVDPTLDDQLQPMPEFSVPQLEPPKFEVSIPSFHRLPLSGGPESPAPSAVAAEAREIELAALADAEASVAVENWKRELAATGESAADAGRAPRHWDLLFQIRSRDVAQNSYKSRFRETREELVQRLLDPSLTLEETARLLGVCPTTVRRYTNRGHLRHFRTSGNQRRFRLSDVLEFLENRASEIEEDARADEEAGTTLEPETGLDD